MPIKPMQISGTAMAAAAIGVTTTVSAAVPPAPSPTSTRTVTSVTRPSIGRLVSMPRLNGDGPAGDQLEGDTGSSSWGTRFPVARRPVSRMAAVHEHRPLQQDVGAHHPSQVVARARRCPPARRPAR